MPAVRSKHSKHYFSPKPRLADIIFGCDEKLRLEDLFNPDLVAVKTLKSDRYFVSANVRFEDLPENMQAKLADRFTRATCDALTSLYLAGNKYVTPEHIAYAMNGYSNKRRKSTPEFLAQIEESVEVLRHTWCRIDATKEAQAKGYNFTETKFDGALIPSDGLEVVDMNGKRTKAYEIFKEPILYRYAKQKGQVLTVDINLLALPEKINMTRENIILRNYLLAQIDWMNHSNRSRTMTYETIFKEIGKQDAVRVEKQRIRQRIRLFLDNWVNLGYIKGYEEEPKTNGLAKEKITITLHEDHYILHSNYENN